MNPDFMKTCPVQRSGSNRQCPARIPDTYNFFQLNFLVLVLRQGIGSATTRQIIILVLGVAVTLIWTVLGRLAARREQTPLLIVFFILSFSNFVYAAYAFATVRDCSR